MPIVTLIMSLMGINKSLYYKNLYIILGISETATIIPIIVKPTGSNTPKFPVIVLIKSVNIALVKVNPALSIVSWI